jgi:hypothetical protein
MFVFQEWLAVVPIPTLESNGLLPRGVHECSLDDISAQFATQCSINQQIFPLIPERFLSELPKPPLPLAQEIAT